MADLELVGIHPDGDHLILIDPDGERHRLTIDEALRAAVRRDRAHLEQVRSAVAPRPRQIQSMIRAGASAQAVATEAGLPVEQVRRYEGPVLAEREYVAQRARNLHIGHSSGSPTLGDLVLDRLAARGVDAATLMWDARREGTDPWHVVARFHAGDTDQEATWEVDLVSGTFTALDDESRWLSETDLGSGSRHLNPVRGARLYDVEADADIAPALHAVDAVIRDSRPRIVPDIQPATPAKASADSEDSHVQDGEQSSDLADPADPAGTEALLAELNGSRGVRQRVEIDDEALAEQVRREDESQPTLWDEAPGAHPAASRPQDATDATVLPGPGSAEEPPARSPRSPAAKDDDGDGRASTSSGDKRSGRRARHSRRTSVPSWDEIVFGAKND